MTGTAMTELRNFMIFISVVSIPTNKMPRKDSNDQIFRTEIKSTIITNKIIECNKRGQPVLVGTTSIENLKKFLIF